MQEKGVTKIIGVEIVEGAVPIEGGAREGTLAACTQHSQFHSMLSQHVATRVFVLAYASKDH
jgi:hypothetical protein